MRLPCYQPRKKARAPSQNQAKILLVEDQRLVRVVANRILSHHGYQVEVTALPHRALQLVEGGYVPDVLLCDLNMPQMSGEELVTKLREIHPNTRVLFLSRAGEYGISPHALAVKNSRILPKPFTKDALLDQLMQLLELN